MTVSGRRHNNWLFITIVAALLACSGLPTPGRAQIDVDRSLMPDDVLASSAQHFPEILESLAKIRAASGAVTAADGAFDVIFESEGFSRATGYYGGTAVDTKVKRQLRGYGANVYGGYKISDGNFPIYEDVNYTNTLGEFKVGALFSLLRDRDTDPYRFKLVDTRLAKEQAELDLLMTRIGVQHKALIAYWRWVAMGQQLVVFEELQAFAEERDFGLREQVESGARAEIFLVENQQNLTRRKRLAAEARQDFLTAANDLALYYRNTDGELIFPTDSQLPPVEFLQAFSIQAAGSETDVAPLLSRRPELRILRTSLERARSRVDLSRNNLSPRLDVKAEVSRDVGRIAEGGISRDSTDLIVGFQFSIPLQRTEARGELQKAEAELAALRHKRRLQEDKIELELRNILIDLEMSNQVFDLAEQEVEQANILREAEQDRFNSGASDFFLVALREETAADARIRYYLSALDARIAQANYDAAALHLDRLGLSGDGY